MTNKVLCELYTLSWHILPYSILERGAEAERHWKAYTRNLVSKSDAVEVEVLYIQDVFVHLSASVLYNVKEVAV